MLRDAGRMALYLNDYERAEVLCAESLVLCRELGDTRGLAHSLHLLAWAARDRDNVTRAGSLFEEALALRRKLGNKEDIAWSLLQWGILICRQGEYARAGALFEESLALFREIAHPHAIGWSLYRGHHIFSGKTYANESPEERTPHLTTLSLSRLGLLGS